MTGLWLWPVWFLCGAAAAWCFRLLPERWLCDYNEQPSACHKAENRRLSAPELIGFGVLSLACTVLLLRQTGLSPARSAVCGIVAAALFSVLLLAALCDAKYTILPDELLALSALLTLGLWLCGGMRGVYTAWYAPFAGAALGFFGLWAVTVLAARLYRTEAMGFGDVKLLAVLGLLCGPAALGAAVLLAVLGAALVFGTLLVLGKAKRRDMLPFGPFLVGGALAAVCLWPLWQRVFLWYLGLWGV